MALCHYCRFGRLVLAVSLKLFDRRSYLGSASRSHVNSGPCVAGERETVEEARVEVVVPPARLEAVVAALREAHPYEEAAFDIYPRLPAPVTTFGMGRIGSLPSPMTQVGCPRSTG